MTHDSLKLTIYFGERDRTDGRFLADALFDVYERHGFATSVLLRGVEGFGIKQRLQTERLLTLSEDLPLVSVAVDTRERIEAALPEIQAITGHGLVSLERARMLGGGLEPVELPSEPGDAVKLTVYGGRAERAGRRPAYVAAVETLRRHGLDGASVLLGVDGTLHGQRRRARFFSRNAGVPLMILSIGRADAVAGVLPELAAPFDRPIATVERVRLCKRDGRHLAEPRHVPEHDDAGLPIWQKLMVHADEQARAGGHPLHLQLVRRLREAGAAGATVLRGIYGFYGDGEPFGDRFLQVRRRVPVVTVIVDTPSNIRSWWTIVDELTADTGVVTSELVPAAHATGPQTTRRPLELASISGVLRALGRERR